MARKLRRGRKVHRGKLRRKGRRHAKVIRKRNNKEQLHFMDVLGQLAVFAEGTTAPAGLVDFAVTFPTNYPLMYRDQFGTYGQLDKNDVSNGALMAFKYYDMYKVTGISIGYRPAGIQQLNALSSSNNVALESVYWWQVDPDDCSLIVDDMRAMNAGIIPKSAYSKSNIRLRNHNKGWMNCQNRTIAPDIFNTVQNTPIANSYSSVKIRFEDLYHPSNADAFYGRLYIKWHVIFKGIADTLFTLVDPKTEDQDNVGNTGLLGYTGEAPGVRPDPGPTGPNNITGGIVG